MYNISYSYTDYSMLFSNTEYSYCVVAYNYIKDTAKTLQQDFMKSVFENIYIPPSYQTCHILYGFQLVLKESSCYKWSVSTYGPGSVVIFNCQR